ncbi:MAG: hypothetical protein KA085_04165 [Phenylobacterium sp.]|uniref:hypothetical protein n=1 Tax=Phenylobacterium sp. TaxID=1871053 RepID=UPI001B7AFD23|nr:hypothetical protein [Phenylobacterium sp.]MBP7815295.1 hypothetical protein [Phenylobacterium sp.]MBP9756875.1 hypothetical protein [Phenylobacterium sp.]
MSGSYARGDQPRSVVDPDKDAYDAMIRDHKARVEGSPGAPPAHPQAAPPRTFPDSVVADVVEVLKAPTKAHEDWVKGDRVKALTEGAVGATEIYLLGKGGWGLLKGQIKLRPPFAWRTKPWEAPGMRKWMTERGILEKGQPGHHALIPANGWGKVVPDWIKNQPFNIKGMESAEEHGLVHGRYKGKARFGPLERYIRGTPNWWKAANGILVGDGAIATESAADDREAGR